MDELPNPDVAVRHDQPSCSNMYKQVGNSDLTYPSQYTFQFSNESSQPTMPAQAIASSPHFASTEKLTSAYPQLLQQASLSPPLPPRLHLATSTRQDISHLHQHKGQYDSQEKTSSFFHGQRPTLFTQLPVPPGRETAAGQAPSHREDPTKFIFHRNEFHQDTLTPEQAKNEEQLPGDYTKCSPGSYLHLNQLATTTFAQHLPHPPPHGRNNNGFPIPHGSPIEISRRSLAEPDLSCTEGPLFHTSQPAGHYGSYPSQVSTDDVDTTRRILQNASVKPLKRTYHEAIGKLSTMDRPIRRPSDSRPTGLSVDLAVMSESPNKRFTTAASASNVDIDSVDVNTNMFQSKTNPWNGTEWVADEAALTNRGPPHFTERHTQFLSSVRDSLDGPGQDEVSSDQSSADPPNMSPVSTQTEKSNDNRSTPYTCAQCAERFTTVDERKSHIRSAHGKRFPCGICKSRFTRRYDLNKHQQIVHEKIRPFVCDVCGSCFGQKHHLVRHKRALHMKAKDYACRMCPSRFSRDEHLHNHTRSIHGMWRPFMCSMCDVQCTDKRALKVHLQSVHQVKSSRAGTFAGWQPDSRVPPPKIREILQL